MACVDSVTEKEVTHLQSGLSGDPSGQLYMAALGPTIQQQGHCSLSTVKCSLFSHAALLVWTNSFRGMDINSCDVCKNYCEQGEGGRRVRVACLLQLYFLPPSTFRALLLLHAQATS